MQNILLIFQSSPMLPKSLCSTKFALIFAAALVTVSVPFAVFGQQFSPNVDLSVQIQGPSGSSVNAGSTISYTYTANNSGPDSAMDVTVTGNIPNGLSYNSAQTSNDCVLNGQQIHCHTLSMQSNSTKQYTVSFDVTASPSFCNQTISNAVSISTSSTETNPTNNQSNTTYHTVHCAPVEADMEITKVASPTVLISGIVYYELTVKNKGPANATNIVVTDTVPTGLAFDSGNSDSSCFLQGNSVKCTANSLNNNSIKVFNIAFTISDQESCGEVILNRASVEADQNDPVSNNNTSNFVYTTILCEKADLSITKSGPSTVDAGGTILYTLTATNNGPAEGESITVSDPVPNGLTFNAAQSSSNCVLNSYDSVVHCNSFSLNALQSKTINIAFDVPENGFCSSTIYNSGTVSGQSTDLNPSNNQSNTVSTVVECEGEPELSISKTDGRTTVNAGESLTYEITVTNHSNIEATGVDILDTLPSNVVLMKIDGNLVSPTGTTVTWDNQTIPANQSKIYTITVGVDSNTPDQTVLTNTVQITNGPTAIDTTTVLNGNSEMGCIEIVKETFNTEGNLISPVAQFTFLLNGGAQTTVNNSNGEAMFLNVPAGLHTVTEIVPNNWEQLSVTPTNGEVVVSVGNNCSAVYFKNKQVIDVDPTFSISKTDNRTTAEIGDVLSYQISVTNTSNVTATGVTIEDTLPLELTLETTSGNANLNGQIITWTDLSFSTGETKIFTITASVKSNINDGVVILNQARVVDGPSTTDTTTVVSEGEADLSISKTDNRSTVENGETLNYIITITNNSSIDANSVEIKDTLPNDTTYVSSSNGGSANGHIITWDQVSISANSSVQLSVNASVNSNTSNGTILLNTVQIVGGNSATDSPTVTSNTTNDVTIDITDQTDPVRPSDVFCYSIRVTNLNSNPVVDATVTQTLDSQTSYTSSTDGGSHSSGLITWDNVDISGTGTKTLNSCVRVDSNADDDDILNSNAYILSKSDSETTRVDDDDDDEGECRIVSIEDDPDPVEPGEIFEYTIKIRNESNDDEEYTITAFLDSDTTYLSSSHGGDDVSRREIEWDDFDIDSDDTETVRITVRMDNDIEEDETVRIRVTCEDDNETETTRVEGGGTSDGDAHLRVDKSANRDEAKPGDTVFYTITVRNDSDEAARNVTVSDRFTAGSISIEDNGNGSSVGNGINWRIPILNVNDSRTFTYKVKVGRDMKHGQLIINTVRVSSSDLDRDATDTEEVRVITDLPQTGISGFFSSWKKANSFLKPSSHRITTPVAQSGTNGAAGISLTSLMSIGLLIGGIAGKKIFL